MSRSETVDKTKAPENVKTIDLDDAKLYSNRELSWLQFNARVLEEALDRRHPLLERVKFLSIFCSNLDEFFMLRVSALRRQLAGGTIEPPPDGMTPAEQLAAIRRELLPLLAGQAECWRKDLLPRLREADVQVLDYQELKGKQRKLLRSYFEREVFPVLTPLACDPGHPFPHISNLSINLAVVISDPQHGERFARLKVPDVFPRLLRVPSEEKAESYEDLGLVDAGSNCFVWMEQVVAANLDLLFPGVQVVAAYPFRVTRDADFEIQEDEASDLLSAIKEGVGARHFGSAVRLEMDEHVPELVRRTLVENLELAPYQVYPSEVAIGLTDLRELTRLDLPELKDPPFLPTIPAPLATGEAIFPVLQRRNILLYHPYGSFAPVAEFAFEAARDPDVLAIKQTLYRVGTNSPVVDALMEAREHGKQVAVLVELKARFDEENNIGWAQALERGGVHVVYGLVGLKTHAKVCLVIRREGRGITRHVHMSTGNYNALTSRTYADIGYFTTDPDIGADASDFFNALTGYSRKGDYRKLLVAPGNMRAEILKRVEREVERRRQGEKGHLAFKLNALTDVPCIKALYRASQAGVKVDLQVRGTCALRPGVSGVSENITVTSLVGRFLEHSRIYYFRNGGQEEVFVGSADLMPRNLDGRVEVLFPIEDARLRDVVKRDILYVHLSDTALARRLLPDSSYERVRPKAGDALLNSQRWMLEHRGEWNAEEPA
jgi:polyphosphate kinase